MMRNRISLLLLALLWVVLPVQGQADLSRLDAYFEGARKAWDVPGMAVAIIKDGQIVHLAGYGARDLDSGELVDEHTLFAIASNTKAFISASVASLVDEGVLTWDDRIVDHVPYFRLVDEVAGQRATLRDALSHGIGLGTYSGDVVWFKSDKTSEEVLRNVAFLPPAFEFRSGYAYNNIMFIAVGEVIGSASGMPWESYISNHFFEPLGMSRSTTSAEAALKKGNVATPHKVHYGENVAVPWTSWSGSGAGAAAGVISTAHDMAQWVTLHLNEGVVGEDTLFSAAEQREMRRPHYNYQPNSQTYPGQNFSGYGLAWGISEYRGHTVVAHSGAYDGMYSRVAMVPDQELGVVVLTNTMKGIGTWLVYDLIDAYLGSSVRNWSRFGLARDERARASFDRRLDEHRGARKPGTLPTLAVADMAGTYHDPLYGEVVVLERDGVFRLEFPRAIRLGATLTHWQDDTWQINWDERHAWFDFGTVTFTIDDDGQVDGLEFSVPNDDIFFEEIHPKK